MNKLSPLRVIAGTIFGGLLFSLTAFAQSPNSLAFDGANDVAVVPGASAYIANATPGMSISCWVYATNPAPSYPNFDGIVGFRNDVSCDFYLLHLSATTVEARFRNSSGIDYTPVITGFQINTWQHLVMTYDGSTIKTYLNGVANASMTASGNISSSSEIFHIGYLPFSPSNFQFGGKLDEIGLWNKALTPAEISCMYTNGHDNSSPNLKLYYRCDQGIPNGSNSNITKLIDAQGNINGNLAGFAMSGSTSNFTQGKVLAGSASATICKGDSVLFGNNYYKQAGIYYATFPSSGPCDSIAQVTITVDSLDVGVVWASSTQLHAKLGGANYQWVNCDSNKAIQGAVLQNFTPTYGGNYAVVLTKGGCTDTSACEFTNVGLTENDLPQLSVYPNPTKGRFTFSQGMDTEVGTLFVINPAGKIVAQIEVENQAETIIDLNLPTGVYTLNFQREDGKHGSSNLVITP
ncbi:LamG-like jellyroll fold domain-containing protein [Owenweeksia hongkongensis]|uniref:LamG-like jellyroll fold domain-containing protein n=1 Tax=Owenweeksia hongkongensis TaxID=253245 RepID=UPI003A8F1AE4